MYVTSYLKLNFTIGAHFVIHLSAFLYILSNRDVGGDLSSSSKDSPSFSSDVGYVTISTKAGLVQGLTMESGAGMVTTLFLGVPYARPPVGSLRFRDPQRHPGWVVNTIINATSWMPECPHAAIDRRHRCPNLAEDGLAKEDSNEDCLYVDIYIPGNLSSTQYINTLELPVLVIFNGGGYFHGQSMGNEPTSALPGGWRSAHYGGMIIVGVEYRTGVLGFLTLPDGISSGNNGLKDQKQALHWIWDNIREFGGSPEKITLFGDWSAGDSIGFHVLSPQSRAFFVRAISQGSTFLSGRLLQTNPKRMMSALAERISCARNTTAAVVECLQDAPLSHLLTASVDVQLDYSAWTPTVDGQFITKNPLEVLREEGSSTIDLMIGISRSDGLCEAEQNPSLERDAVGDAGTSSKSFDNIVAETILKTFKISDVSANTDHCISAAILEYTSCSAADDVVQRTVDFFADFYFFAPAELLARLASRFDRRVYFYGLSGSSCCQTISKVTEHSNTLVNSMVNFIRNG